MQTAVPIRANGSAPLKANGSAPLVEPGEGNCCCGACFLGGGGVILRYGDRHTSFPSYPARPPNQTQCTCHKLFVWWSRSVSAGVYSVLGNPDPDYVLTTNEAGARGPFSNPFETSPGSGIPLDTEPYWFSDCRIGGWDILTLGGVPGGYPLLADVQPYCGLGPGDTGTFSLIALVRFNRWKNSVANGGGDLILPADGQIKLIQCYNRKY